GIAPAAGTAPAVTIGSDVSLQPVQARGGDVKPVEPDSDRASAHVRTPQTAAMPAREASLSLPGPVRVTEHSNTPAPGAAPMPAAGAQGTGNISGTAVDASGGVLPGATVRLFDPGRGFEVRTTVADTLGRFEFRDLLVGQYELTLSLAGFAMVHTTL